ncbi:MAG: hypothetical protein M0036_05635 [Desulfobacteraceae bacterium]|nr:hypothetical protein [Desulfobacteraceae bacterium]
MDDFLHNLRSGKLKQGGGNRPYNDPQYKGGARRNPMDRRNKGHHDNKESTERLNAIKEVLENLDKTQKKMADAYIARTRAEERKARAMEILAKNLYKMLNPNAQDVDQLFAEEPAPIPVREEVCAPVDSDSDRGNRNEDFDDEQDGNDASEPRFSDSEEAYDEVSDEDEEDFNTDEELDADNEGGDDEDENENGDRPTKARLTEVDRHTLFSVIGQMREAGEGWEKIARHISAQGYPTISGKGQWRGIMVKTLFEKMDEE